MFKVRPYKLKEIGEKQMKKSSIAKFLLGTMVLPTALAGNCNADPLDKLSLAEVVKYLRNSKDKCNLRSVNKKAGEAFKVGYLSDLRKPNSFTNLEFGIPDESIKRKIENYISDHANQNMQGTIFASEKNLDFNETPPPLIEKLINNKIKEKISIIKFDRINLTHEALENLNIIFYKEFPKNMATDTISLSDEVFNLEDIQKFAAITSREKMKFKSMIFENVSSENLNTLDMLLSNLKFRYDAKIGIHFSVDNNYDDTLSQLLKKYSYMIDYVRFPESSVETVEPLLTNIPIKKYFESPCCDYMEKLTPVQTTFRQFHPINNCYVENWENINLEEIENSQPLNVDSLTFYLNPRHNLIESTYEEIQNYFEDRHAKIDAIFDNEKHIKRIDVTNYLPLNENVGVTRAQRLKKLFINYKLIDELKHISQRLRRMEGKLVIQSIYSIGQILLNHNLPFNNIFLITQNLPLNVFVNQGDRPLLCD